MAESESQPTAPAQSKRAQQVASVSLIDRRRRVPCARTLFGPSRVVGLLQVGFSRARVPGLRHGKPKQEQACYGDAGKGQEGGAVSQADDHEASDCRRQRRSDTLRGDDGALRDVEPAGATHQVGDDDREDRAVDASSDAVEKLHADEPVWIVGQRVEHTAYGQDEKPDEEQGLSTPGVRFRADEHGHRNHDDLRGNDAGRHQAGPRVLVLQRKLLADERKHGRVGKME